MDDVYSYGDSYDPDEPARRRLLERANHGRTRNIWSDEPIERSETYSAEAPAGYDPEKHWETDYHLRQSLVAAELRGFSRRLDEQAQTKKYSQFDRERHRANFKAILRYRYGQDSVDPQFLSWSDDRRRRARE